MQEKIATETFLNGFNCAQSVLSTFAPGLGISRGESLKLATPLGSGINSSGQTCGAVLGGYLVLGLKFGTDQPADTEGKARCKQKVDQFTQKFLEHYDSVNCNGLLPRDVSVPGEREKLMEEGAFKNICPKIVGVVTNLIEDVMREEN